MYTIPPEAVVQQLRASCAFCRKRKIKCSGEPSGCTACVARSQPCIYEASAPMGRPRKLTAPETSTSAGVKERRPGAMSKIARGVAKGEAGPPSTASLDELENDMLKLRLTAIRSTYEMFENSTVGMIVTSFYGLVSSSPDAPPPSAPRPTYRAPQGLRFMYELAFQSRKAASRPRSTGAEKIAKEAATHKLWKRFPSELVSLATAGIPSSYDDNLEETLFVRLLQEDESKKFDYPTSSPPPNPLGRLTTWEITTIVTNWFLRSPISFVINDGLFLESILTGTYSPALLSIIVGISLTQDDKIWPPSSFLTHLSALPQLSSLDPAPFLSYGEHLLFSCPVRSAVDSLEVSQALTILGAFYGNNHMARRSWSAMSAGNAVARESLRKVQEAISEGAVRSEVEKVRDEMLVNVLWLLGIYGAWCFLSLDLPRSVLANVADSLPLPPLLFSDSASYIYRSGHPHSLPECTTALQTTLTGFTETCRTLSIIVALSVRNGPPGVARNPTPGDDGSHPSRLMDVSVARWLLNIAEDFSKHPLQPFGFTQRGKNTFLSCVHAIMALHRLAPFNKPSEAMMLSSAALRLAMRAMEILIEGSMPEVRVALKIGDGKVLMETAKTGLLRLIGDCLPHCLRFMDHLAESAKTSAVAYAIIFEEQTHISPILEGLVFLTDSGLTVVGSDTNTGARRVQLSVAAFHSSSQSSSNYNKRQLSPTSNTQPDLRVPPPPMVPAANHFRSLSSTSSTSSCDEFGPLTSMTPFSSRNRFSASSAGSGSRSRSTSTSSITSFQCQRQGRDRSSSSSSLLVPSPASFGSSTSFGSMTSLSSSTISESRTPLDYKFTFLPGEQWGLALSTDLPPFPEEGELTTMSPGDMFEELNDYPFIFEPFRMSGAGTSERN